MYRTITFTILNFMYLISSGFSDDLCPKVCSICFNDHLSCTTGGLLTFPLKIHETTTKITLIGHTFESSFLSKSNFSRYSKPRYSIEQLSIRRSNINSIESNTFYDLSGLDNLDLSSNRKMVVHSRAFANLKLKHLKLDDIQVLELKEGAFEGLMVSSLSIKNSRIKTLSFDLLLPIKENLRNLFLSNNHIAYLESRFEPLFRNLTRLDLTKNPFQCTCEMAWLGRVMLEKFRRAEVGDSTFSYNGLNPGSEYPTCVGPQHVRGHLIHNISDAEFSCTPPSLDLIDIRFESPKLVRLQCSARMAFKAAPLQVVWQQLSGTKSMTFPTLEKTGPHQAVALVKRSSSTNLYQCLATSNSGNATVKINITWPTAPNESANTDQTKLRDKTEWFNKANKQLEKNFFFKEQFTLLEMLGAVMGTFTVTLTAFLLLYRLCFRVSNKTKKTNSIKKSGYSIYEPAVYSDSQTYDIPQNNYSIASPTFITNTLPINAPSHYIDYRTQQRISHH